MFFGTQFYDTFLVNKIVKMMVIQLSQRQTPILLLDNFLERYFESAIMLSVNNNLTICSNDILELLQKYISCFLINDLFSHSQILRLNHYIICDSTLIKFIFR